MDAENSMDDFVASKPTSPYGDLQVSHNASGEYVRGLNTSRNVVYHSVHLKEVVDRLSIIDKDCTNQITFIVPVASAGSTKKWKKHA
nr:hypothetical protein CFP56_17138 [Quercus suber]